MREEIEMEYKKIITKRRIPEVMIECDSCDQKFILLGVQLIEEDGMYIQEDEVRLRTQVWVDFCPYCGAKGTPDSG